MQGGLYERKKKDMSRLKMMLLVVFFDWKGIVHHEFVTRVQMVNSCTRKF